MKMFIYTLKDPMTDEIRYVGKTKNLKDRLYRHTAPAYLKNDKHLHKTRWIQKLLNVDHLPIMEVLEECTNENVNELEQYWIEQLRAWNIKLTNHSTGGEGFNWTGRNHSKETKRKLQIINSSIIIEYDLVGNKLNSYIGVPEAARETGFNMTVVIRNHIIKPMVILLDMKRIHLIINRTYKQVVHK